MTELPIHPNKYYLQKVTADGVRLIVPTAFDHPMAAVALATVTLPNRLKAVKPEYSGFTIVTGLSIITGAPYRLEPYIPHLQPEPNAPTQPV